MGDNFVDEEQEAVTKTLAGEKKKLSHMTFSQKIDYIFTYYKFHILGILLVIAIVIYIIHQRMTYVTYVLYGSIINSNTYNEAVEDEIEEALQMGKHEGVTIAAGLSGDVDNNAGAYYNQTDLLVVAGQMDFAFTDEAGVQYLCNMGIPLDVTAELPTDLLDLWAGREAVFSEADAAEDDVYFENAAAIDISGTKVQEYFGLDDNMCYLVICDLSGHTDYMQAFYEMLYEIETDTLE